MDHMDEPERLTIEADHDGHRPCLRCIGELDAAGAATLTQAIEDLGASTQIGLDLAGLTFLDSSGIRVIAAAANRAAGAGGSIQVVEASPIAAKVLALTGLDDLLSS